MIAIFRDHQKPDEQVEAKRCVIHSYPVLTELFKTTAWYNLIQFLIAFKEEKKLTNLPYYRNEEVRIMQDTLKIK